MSRPLVDTFGTLSGSGTATAQFALPAGLVSGIEGQVLHHAALVLEPGTFAVLAASNAVPVTMAP